MAQNADQTIELIKKTRKCRIKASERLKRWNVESELLLTYYSLIIVALSIWNIQSCQQKISILLLIASVCLTIGSIYINSQKYNERSIQFKNNYIELARLWNLLEEQKTDVSILASIQDKYCTLMQTVENHNDYDYLLAIIAMNEEKLTGFQKIKLAIYIIFELIILVSFIVLPIIIKIHFLGN